KFGDDRRTELSLIEGEIDVEDLIAVDYMVVSLTNMGYVKRLPKSTYRAQNRGGKGITGMTTREEDFARQIRIASTHDEIMFFTNRGRVYNIKCFQIPEAGRTAKGTALVNLLPLTGGEKVTTMIPMPKNVEGKFLMMATRDGLIKKTAVEEFANLRKAGLIAIVLREEDELVGVELTSGQDDLIMGTRRGRAIRFSEEHVRAMGRVSQGVRSIKLEEGDYVIDMAAIEEGGTVLCISENGYGKRTDPDQYREQGRGGKGVTAMALSEKTGYMAAQLIVQPGEDILLITGDGTIIRTPADDIRVAGRNTQGVRLMRLSEGSHIVAVARAEAEETEDAVDPAEENVQAAEAPVQDASETNNEEV
ncbi:MAG: DNA gyrase subunit A, partial [Clostridia bacterium]|nr:DNA gyrase subunit A [Clostridia bacterium]